MNRGGPGGEFLYSLNVELTGRQRRGALAARQMMNQTAARPGRHAVGSPVERRVRPQFALSDFSFRFPHSDLAISLAPKEKVCVLVL